jgi:hypothetical protein
VISGSFLICQHDLGIIRNIPWYRFGAQLNGGRHGRDLQLLITPFDIFNMFLYGQLQAKVALLVITESEK